MTLRTATTTTTDQAELLRKVLRADAASSAGLGAVLAAASVPLGGLLGLSPPLMICAGVALLFGGAALGLLAGYPSIPTALARAVLALTAPRPKGRGFPSGSRPIVPASQPTAEGRTLAD